MGKFVRLSPDRQILEVISTEEQYDQKLIWLYTNDDRVKVGQFFIGDEFTYETKLDELQEGFNSLNDDLEILENKVDSILPAPIPNSAIDILFGDDVTVEDNEILFNETGIYIGNLLERDEGRVLINNPGRYFATGTGFGSIIINSDDVVLELRGVTISGDAAPIQINGYNCSLEVIENSSLIYLGGLGTDVGACILADTVSFDIVGSARLVLESESYGIYSTGVANIGSSVTSLKLDIASTSDSIFGEEISLIHGIFAFVSKGRGLVTSLRDVTLSGGICNILSGDTAIQSNSGVIKVDCSLFIESSVGNTVQYSTEFSNSGVLCIGISTGDMSYPTGRYVEFKGLRVVSGSRISVRTSSNTVVYNATVTKDSNKILYASSAMSEYYLLYVNGALEASERTVG